jgi:hypothetical protein
MGIRNHNKDHLRELAPNLVAVPIPSLVESTEDPLRFWTKHERPTLVELHIFVNGDDGLSRKHGTPGARSSFSGRPNLIHELAPALRALLEYASPRSVSQYIQALRDWWRLFDSVEQAANQGTIAFEPVRSVADIGELHRQRAMDDGMERGAFGSILVAINIVRKNNGLRHLMWRRPDPKSRSRKLPPEWHIRTVRIALKHSWFAILGRWERAGELLAGRTPANEEEQRLLNNYQVFKAVSAKTLHPRPPAVDLWDGVASTTFNNRGFSVPDMQQGFYPDAEDIRVAFHLCLASTGWNPAVFLSLDANSQFIEPHPKDPTRYLLRGYKFRARSEQMSEGLYKTQGSAGFILLTLLERTAPLRAQLRLELEKQESRYHDMLLHSAPIAEMDAQRKRVEKLREGVSSVWLYVTATSDEISWFNPNESQYSRGTGGANRITFLDRLVARINKRQPADRQVANIKAGDFRDAYAAYAYQISGGMVLYVMKALGQRSLRSTKDYLDNTLLNAESNRLYRTFSNAMWHEIKVHKRLDPTVIAKHSRDGVASQEHRDRLATYRNLRRSRIDVGCRDPQNPPKRIAPRFQADGKEHCHVQRCMLCVENAVLFPDSVRGVCKRLAELRHIRSRMSSVAFIESSFDEELENTEIALAAYDPAEVANHLEDWEARIHDGRHRIVDLDGLQTLNV